jgi:hypothetical protein
MPLRLNELLGAVADLLQISGINRIAVDPDFFHYINA